MPADTAARADAVVIGAGIAGLVATLELLEAGRRVVLLDRCHPHEIGGLAREAFGGTFMVDTPEQRFSGIEDSFELAWADWQRIAEFEDDDVWPRRWAEQYVRRATDEVGAWLKSHGVRFFPVVNWTERGVYGEGNSVPRFHLTWGCGQGMVDGVAGAIERHPRRASLDLRFRQRVTRIEPPGTVAVEDEDSGASYEVEAGAVVIAAGGIGGNLDLVRRHWPENMGAPPEQLLMGSHYYADGAMHAEAERVGGNVTHLGRMWNYADAVHHPKPRRPGHGVKLIPPRSGLLLNPDGRRYGPIPVIPTFDAYHALERMCEDPRKYSWLVCNWKIARRELDVSGSEHNPHIREKRLVRFLLSVLLGKPHLVRYFVDRCPDFVTADSLPELARRMNELTGTGDLDGDVMAQEVLRYDSQIKRGKSLHNDDQLRRIAQLRNWRGDRLRTANFARITDPKAGPLIAIRLQPMVRKSLGGIQTDLESRVLTPDGTPIPTLYAVGEAAGFGGGGLHGKRSLEGTFLGACVFSARVAARSIAG
jgi:predicted oxidoreductase